MSGLQIDFSGVSQGVVDEFIKGRQAKETLALMKAPAEQDLMAAQNRKDHRSIEGLGRVRMNVGATAYHYWGQRLGYACWRDKQFLREYERDNPQVKVKCGGTKIQTGYDKKSPPEPLTGSLVKISSGGKRFTKTYPV